MNSNIEKAAYTISEFMAAYGIGKTKTYQEINEGRLRIRKVGKRTLVAKVDADNWLNSLPEAT